MTNVLSTVDKKIYDTYEMEKVGDNYIKIPKPYICGIKNCNLRFRDKEDLDIHLKKHEESEMDQSEFMAKKFEENILKDL